MERVLEDPDHAPRLAQAVALLRTVDVLHIVGGGYINSIWPRHVGLFAAAAWLARNCGTRTVGTGLGLTPADEGVADVLRSYAPSFSMLGVRDDHSMELLEHTDVAELVPDDIFLEDMRALSHPDSTDAPEFMVCVQGDLLTVDCESITNSIVATLRGWGAGSSTVGTVECIPGGDSIALATLHDNFGDVRRYTAWEVIERGLPVGPHQKWISSRYHPHLVAAAAGAQGATLSVQPQYYDVKHAAARRMGSAWTSLVPGDELVQPGESRLSSQVAASHRAGLIARARRIYG